MEPASRAERHLMRQRGAGLGQLKCANFGFALGVAPVVRPLDLTDTTPSDAIQQEPTREDGEPPKKRRRKSKLENEQSKTQEKDVEAVKLVKRRGRPPKKAAREGGVENTKPALEKKSVTKKKVTNGLEETNVRKSRGKRKLPVVEGALEDVNSETHADVQTSFVKQECCTSKTAANDPEEESIIVEHSKPPLEEIPRSAINAREPKTSRERKRNRNKVETKAVPSGQNESPKIKKRIHRQPSKPAVQKEDSDRSGERQARAQRSKIVAMDDMTKSQGVENVEIRDISLDSRSVADVKIQRAQRLNKRLTRDTIEPISIEPCEIQDQSTGERQDKTLEVMDSAQTAGGIEKETVQARGRRHRGRPRKVSTRRCQEDSANTQFKSCSESEDQRGLTSIGQTLKDCKSEQNTITFGLPTANEATETQHVDVNKRLPQSNEPSKPRRRGRPPKVQQPKAELQTTSSNINKGDACVAQGQGKLEEPAVEPRKERNNTRSRKTGFEAEAEKSKKQKDTQGKATSMRNCSKVSRDVTNAMPVNRDGDDNNKGDPDQVASEAKDHEVGGRCLPPLQPAGDEVRTEELKLRFLERREGSKAENINLRNLSHDLEKQHRNSGKQVQAKKNTNVNNNVNSETNILDSEHVAAQTKAEKRHNRLALTEVSNNMPSPQRNETMKKGKSTNDSADWDKQDWFEPSIPSTLFQKADKRLKFCL